MVAIAKNHETGNPYRLETSLKKGRMTGYGGGVSPTSSRGQPDREPRPAFRTVFCENRAVVLLNNSVAHG